jgi:hypothetical protein
MWNNDGKILANADSTASKKLISLPMTQYGIQCGIQFGFTNVGGGDESQGPKGLA